MVGSPFHLAATIQQAGGWQSPQMVARYASAVAVAVAVAVEDGAVARYFGG